MKLSTCALIALLATDGVNGFTVPKPSSAFSRTASLHMTIGEFDHILREGGSPNAGKPRVSARKSILRVPDGSDAITLTSSVAADAPAGSTDEQFFDAQQNVDDFAAVDDPFAESSGGGERQVFDDPRVQEIVKQKEKRLTEGRFKFEPMKIIEGKDFTDLFFTVFVPLGLTLYGARWAYRKSSGYLSDTAEFKLEDYANEMVYHDGDFEEMKMCHSDYKKKLSWLGPNKKDRMIKSYLAALAKKIAVSPKSISSLSYVFSLYKLSEDKAAKILTETCLDNPERAASNQKLLFFGNHILKSPEARSKLQPIKDMLTESYRDDGVSVSGEVILEKSQEAMGEAAYRATVTAGGKNQSKLTPGWEVLGLNKETATRIFEEEKESGFISSQEAKYGRTAAKYDAKGRRLDKDGTVEDDNGVGDDDGSDDEPTSNVYECGECGYTLFIAEGRNHKFFGAGFECPECGAKKDKFVGRTAGDD